MRGRRPARFTGGGSLSGGHSVPSLRSPTYRARASKVRSRARDFSGRGRAPEGPMARTKSWTGIAWRGATGNRWASREESSLAAGARRVSEVMKPSGDRKPDFAVYPRTLRRRARFDGVEPLSGAFVPILGPQFRFWDRSSDPGTYIPVLGRKAAFQRGKPLSSAESRHPARKAAIQGGKPPSRAQSRHPGRRAAIQSVEAPSGRETPATSSPSPVLRGSARGFAPRAPEFELVSGVNSTP